MSLQVEKMEKNMAKLTIEVAAEDLEKAMQNAYQKAKGRISIPGFRKGKAPRKMIEQMYGKGVFLEDAVNALIPEHYSKALAECELEIVSQPTIDITQAEPGKAFIFTAEVATKPEVTLGDYKGVEVPKTEMQPLLCSLNRSAFQPLCRPFIRSGIRSYIQPGISFVRD